MGITINIELSEKGVSELDALKADSGLATRSAVIRVALRSLKTLVTKRKTGHAILIQKSGERDVEIQLDSEMPSKNPSVPPLDETEKTDLREVYSWFSAEDVKIVEGGV
jgi:hypothetical protein